MQFIILFLAAFAFAQTETPSKENNNDLRSNTVLFTLQDLSKDRTFILERNADLDHFLRLIHDDDQALRKVDTRDAKKLDLDFAARFLKLQYELPANPEKCKTAYRLNMKGEEQTICEKDEKKTQELASVLENLNKRFQ